MKRLGERTLMRRIELRETGSKRRPNHSYLLYLGHFEFGAHKLSEGYRMLELTFYPQFSKDLKGKHWCWALPLPRDRYVFLRLHLSWGMIEIEPGYGRKINEIRWG